MKLKPVIRGLISYIPGLLPVLKKKFGKGICGGTDSARYCYSIWLRHLIYINKNYGKKTIKEVAEIGPGDSLGTGIMALITGAEKYYAFEVKKFIKNEKNIQVFDEMCKMFINKTDIPGEDEFPQIQPKISDVKFPEYLFKDNFEILMDKNRLDKIRKAISDESCDEFEIRYIIPWNQNYGSVEGKINVLFTQAVMEHLNDLDNSYEVMFKVLSPGGIISHEIDYSAHETHEKWNGHLNFGKLLWSIILHGRAYDINRKPHSEHIRLINQKGFNQINEYITLDNSPSLKIKNKKIKLIFTEKDYNIQNAFVQALKP